MGESDLKAQECNENSKCIKLEDTNMSESATSVDLFKGVVGSFVSGGEVCGSLINDTTQCSDLPDTKNMEMLVDTILKKAKEKLNQKTSLSIDSFRCTICYDVIADPVTLACGHTFSKKCILSVSKHGFFQCRKCSKSYSLSYITRLKNNVKMSSLIESFINHTSHKGSETSSCEKHTNSPLHLSSENQPMGSIIENYCSASCVSPLSYLMKGDELVTLRKFEEAIVSYLICYTIDSSFLQAKEKVIKELNENRNGSNDCSETAIYDSNIQPILNMFYAEIEKIRGESIVAKKKDVPSLDKKDFECSLCMRVLWQPVTTTCGHTFCRVCLYRCFDHQPICPLCKTSLVHFLAERVDSCTELLEVAIETLLPNKYQERKVMYQEEINEFSGKGFNHVIPIFVCTIAFPTVPCPLHIFEPRYRLMIRQCMESGSRQFGMCAVFNNSIAEYGTLLEIRDVRYFTDGRSAVDTIGSRRFRILQESMRDGYHTAEIEFITDHLPSVIDKSEIENFNNEVYKTSQSWFFKLPRTTKHQILQHFGPMPKMEHNYLSLSDGPSWFWWMVAILPLEPISQFKLLSMTSLFERLKILNKMLLHLLSIT